MNFFLGLGCISIGISAGIIVGILAFEFAVSFFRARLNNAVTFAAAPAFILCCGFFMSHGIKLMFS